MGILRYKKFLKIFTDVIFSLKSSLIETKDETLFHIIIYITIFRLDEIPLEDYNSLLLVSFIFIYY